MTTLTSSWDATTGGCPVTGIGSEYRPFEQEGMYDFFARARHEEPVLS